MPTIGASICARKDPQLLPSSRSEYSVYYVAADKGSTTNVPVPLDDSNNERPNTISGNNVDGYIVCVNMTENAAPADSSSQTDQQAATE